MVLFVLFGEPQAYSTLNCNQEFPSETGWVTYRDFHVRFKFAYCDK